MIERFKTRLLFPNWADGSRVGTRFLRVTGAGKAYLSLADDRDNVFVFTETLPDTIEEAISMIDDQA